MAITQRRHGRGIHIVTQDYAPVNALPVQGWFDIARFVDEAGADPETRVVVLRAEGRGFNAGVDIKQMQETAGFDALLGANAGCYAAFKAIYECPVPVIAAVHGFCIGGGVGLAGSADTIIAADDAWFQVPEVDRGALGAATHLSRLVPPQLMRTLYYTSRRIDAARLHDLGTVYQLVPAAELENAALALAEEIADRDPRVIRAAKAALNGIDPVDLVRSYRFEQGYTFELNLAGVSDELRDAFVEDGDPAADA